MINFIYGKLQKNIYYLMVIITFELLFYSIVYYLYIALFLTYQKLIIFEVHTSNLLLLLSFNKGCHIQ